MFLFQNKMYSKSQRGKNDRGCPMTLSRDPYKKGTTVAAQNQKSLSSLLFGEMSCVRLGGEPGQRGQGEYSCPAL